MKVNDLFSPHTSSSIYGNCLGYSIIGLSVGQVGHNGVPEKCYSGSKRSIKIKQDFSVDKSYAHLGTNQIYTPIFYWAK